MLYIMFTEIGSAQEFIDQKKPREFSSRGFSFK